MEKTDYNELASKIFCFGVLGIAIFLFAKYALVYFLPFIIAWGIAYLVRPMAKELRKRTKISFKLCSFFLVFLIVAAVFSILFLVISRVFYEIWGFLQLLVDNSEIIADYFGKFFDFFNSLSDKISALNEIQNTEMLATLKENIAVIIKGIGTSLLERLVSGIPTVLSDVAVALPNALLFVLITLVSCFYFSIDIDYLHLKIKKILPRKIIELLRTAKKRASFGFKKYIKAYLVLFVLTFAELFIGFLILGIEYALALSMLIAFVDFLPVFGTPAILIPWGVIALFMGNNFVGIGLFVLCTVIVVIRQIIEPKILGSSLGVHPLIILVSLYWGYRVWGFAGMILLPILSLVFFAKDDSEKET